MITKEKLEERADELKCDILRHSQLVKTMANSDNFTGIEHHSKIIIEKCARLTEIENIISYLD